MEISENLVSDIKDQLRLINDWQESNLETLREIEKFKFSLGSEDIHRIMDYLPSESKVWNQLAKLADEMEFFAELRDKLDTYEEESSPLELIEKLDWAELGVIR